MCRYKKIDLENWCRKEHYLYYTNSLNVEVNMTLVRVFPICTLYRL